jgi:hypothetical protein
VRKADDLIQRFLDSIGQTEGSVYVGLFRSWRSIVGERIDAHAQPVDIRGHSLVVEADHPGWVQMVMMSRSRIINELNRRFPELTITGLTVRVVDQPGFGVRAPATASDDGRAGGDESIRPVRSAEPDTESPPPPPPSRDEKQALERIEDEELRDALARLRKDLDDRGE